MDATEVAEVAAKAREVALKKTALLRQVVLSRLAVRRELERNKP